MKLSHVALVSLLLLVAAGIYLTLQSDMDGRVTELQANFDRELEKRDREFKAQMTKANDQLKATEKAIARDVADVTKEAEAETKEAHSLNNALANVRTNLNPGAVPVPPTPGLPPPPGEPDPTIDAGILEVERQALNATGAGMGIDRVPSETGEDTGIAPEEDTTRMTQLQSMIINQPRIARVLTADPRKSEGFVVLDAGLNAGLKRGDSFAVRRGTALIGRVTIGDTIQADQCVADVDSRRLVSGLVIKEGDEIIKFDR